MPQGKSPNNQTKSSNGEHFPYDPGSYTEESKQKTVTRTFRLDERLNESLENFSNDAQVTPSNLLNQILTQFVNWNRFVNTRDSPFITLYSHTLSSFMETVDEETLLSIARDVEARATIDYIKYRWGKLNVRNFVRYLRLLSAYSNQGQINFIRPNGGNAGVEGNAEELLLEERDIERKLSNVRSKSPTDNHSNATLVIVAIRHRLGTKWSKFMGTLVTSVFKSMGVNTELEISNNSCFVTVKKSNVREHPVP